MRCAQCASVATLRHPRAATCHNDLRFSEAKLDRIQVDAQDGGTCGYTVRVRVHPEDGEQTARIVDLLHQPDVRGTLEASEEALQGSGDEDDE